MPKSSPKQLSKYQRIEALKTEKGLSTLEACKTVGVNKSNYYYWKAKKPAVQVIEYDAKQTRKKSPPPARTFVAPLAIAVGTPAQVAAFYKALV